jgi:type I restriction enzyme R subunit
MRSEREMLDLILNFARNHDAVRAVADLGQPDEINKVFVGFQKYLYQAPIAV